MRAAIIGLGGQGKKYARMLAENPQWGMSLTAVSTRSEENQAWARRELPQGVFIAGDEEELYTREDLFDALLITTPHRQHPGIALRAFERGKHVLSDKPAGVTLGEARQMEEAAREAGLYYGLFFHQKCQPKYKRVKALLEEGVLGEIRRIEMVNTLYFRTAFYHASGPWRSSWAGEGGGALINQGHHFLCLWQWLFGLPEAIYAQIPFGKYNDFAVDDEATILMDYPGKTTARFFISTREGSGQERLEVVGTKGSLLVDGQKLLVTTYSQDLDVYAGTAQVTDARELEETTVEEVFEQAGNPYGEILMDFAQAVETYNQGGGLLRDEERQSRLISPGYDGLATLALCNGAYLSAVRGQRVSLPLEEDQVEACLEELILREGQRV